MWFVIFAVSFALPCGNSSTLSASERLSGLTRREAAALAVLVVRHQIEDIKHKGNFSLDPFDPEPDNRFYTFEALGVWSPEPGSAVIGHYSVNKKTGDVWDLFTCKKVDFDSLRILRERYLHQAGFASRKDLKSVNRSAVPVFCPY